MSVAVDAAICAALADGTVTSTSVLATGPSFSTALRSVPTDVCLGVHLDLTGFSSLTGAPELEELRRDAASPAFDLRPGLGRLATKQRAVILDEWRAQVEQVRASGREVTHLDSHQHVHWQADLWPILEALLLETGIRAVRGIGAWRPEVSRLRALPQAARAARFHRAFARFVTTAAFANASTFRAREEAGALRPDSLEVMVHPGNPAHGRYAEELDWIQAGSWRAGTTPVTWRELVATAGE